MLTPDDRAQVGFFCKIIDGPHKGRYGTLTRIGDTRDGQPLTGVVRTRDDRDEGIVVKYEHLRPDRAGRR